MQYPPPGYGSVGAMHSNPYVAAGGVPPHNPYVSGHASPPVGMTGTPGNPYVPPPYAVHHDPAGAAPLPPGALDLSTEEDRVLLAQAEQDVLLLLLDDIITDAATKGKSIKDTNVDPAKTGLASKVTFTQVEGVESLDTTDERMQGLYKERRGHRSAKRYSMTDIVDTFLEKVSDTIHSNAAMNHLESKVKRTGYRLMGSLGGKLDKAASSVKGILPGSSTSSAPCQLSEKTHSSLEVAECKLDWGGRWPLIPASSFGDTMRQKHFSILQRGNCSPATIGITPDAVREAHRQWDVANQADPVLWRFKVLPLRVRQAEHAIAHQLGFDPNDVKFCSNADQGISTIVKSLEWQVGDAIVYTSDLTLATKHLLRRIAFEKGLELHELDIPLPNSSEHAADFLRHSLGVILGVADPAKSKSPHHRVRLAIFPEVGCTGGLHLSVRRVGAIFHKVGISVLVDSSLAAGQHDMESGADWHVATLSHWLFTEPGTAVIIAHPLKQVTTETLTVSYFDRGCANAAGFNPSFEKEFSYQGLLDFAPWCSVHQAVKFVSKACGGMEAVRKHNRHLAKRVAEAVRQIWGTEPVQLKEEFGAMPVIPLPNSAGCHEGVAANLTAALATYQNGAVYFVHIVSLTVNGVQQLCARFSCQVYNDLSEYQDAAHYIASLQPYIHVPQADVPDLAWYGTIN